MTQSKTKTIQKPDDAGIECPIYKTLKIVGKKWTLLILRELQCRKPSRMRYNELQRSLNWISPTILSSRLKEMEKNGLINRKIHPNDVPVKVEYSLTEKGKDLYKVIMSMKEWGIRWMVADKAKMMLCDKCGSLEQ